MGMGENDCIDAGGRDRQRFPIEFTQIFHALKQAAIDQDALAVMLEQMFRTGDGSGGAKRGHGEHQAAFQFADGGVMRSWGSPLPSTAAHSAVGRNRSRGRFSSRAALSARWAQVERLANSIDRKSTRLNSSHSGPTRMPLSA